VQDVATQLVPEHAEALTFVVGHAAHAAPQSL
jgi:hypothetical protein